MRTQAVVRAVAEAGAANDVISEVNGRLAEVLALAHQGDVRTARIAADAALEASSRLSESFEAACRSSRMAMFLAMGDTAAAWEASEAARADPQQYGVNIHWWAQAALAHGDLAAARRFTHDAASRSMGWWVSWGLLARARVALADGSPEKAERDAHDALVGSADIGAHLAVPDALECLAACAAELGSQREAARLVGAAAAARLRMGSVRFKILDAEHEELVARLRDDLGDSAFDAAVAEGEVLSTEEAIAYAQRGRGERKRPASGWASLTPTEFDVVRLVGEGLPNKHIAAQLFISTRTVESHLTHVYRKLGLTSRVQLAQEAARRFDPSAG